MAVWTPRRTSSTSATSPSGSATCSPTATRPPRVPSCPDWRADDLLWHLGEVQHWWTWMVTQPARRDPTTTTEPERPGDHAGLLAFYDEQYVALVDALGGGRPHRRGLDLVAATTPSPSSSAARRTRR